MFDRLTQAILLLAREVRDLVVALGGSGTTQPTAILTRLARLEERVMSVISKFATEQKAFNERIDLAVAGLGTDIQALNDKIEELQNSPGTITPEDQALLDELQARAEGITSKLEALDALTPPTPPVG